MFSGQNYEDIKDHWLAHPGALTKKSKVGAFADAALGYRTAFHRPLTWSRGKNMRF